MYRAIGISKQGVHSLLDNIQRNQELEASLLLMVYQIRRDHPTMSLRSMYHKIKPSHLGRDRFEALCVAHGFKIEQVKNYRRTTYSNGVQRFPNLIVGIEVVTINQVWVSDITYFELDGRFYYITFVMDSYSRFIKGYSVSSSLRTTETTIPALNMALRKHKIRAGLIFHSDGGGQYYSKEFLRITEYYHIRNSMSKESYENPQAERINRTIKHNYLFHCSIKSLKDLQKAVDRSVWLYNHEKPHKSLKYSTPKMIEDNYYICYGQSVEGEESRTANNATIGALSPSVAGQSVSGSDVHPANRSLKVK